MPTVVCDCVKYPDLVSILLKRAHRLNTSDAYTRVGIKVCIVQRSLSYTHSYPRIHFVGAMGSSQPFIPVLKDIPHPSRGLSSSIWAPQPHPTEASWQKAITSFSQSAEDKPRMRPDDKRGPTFAAPNRNMDVFGPIDFLSADNKKDVGAIGDGRKRASPDTVNNVNSIFCIMFVDVGS